MNLIGSNTFAGHTARTSPTSVGVSQCEGACSAVVDAPSGTEGERRFESGRSRSLGRFLFAESANRVARRRSGDTPHPEAHPPSYRLSSSSYGPVVVPVHH